VNVDNHLPINTFYPRRSIFRNDIYYSTYNSRQSVVLLTLNVYTNWNEISSMRKWIAWYMIINGDFTLPYLFINITQFQNSLHTPSYQLRKCLGNICNCLYTMQWENSFLPWKEWCWMPYQSLIYSYSFFSTVSLGNHISNNWYFPFGRCNFVKEVVGII